MNRNILYRVLLVVFSLLLGTVFSIDIFSKIYSIVIIIIGLFYIVKNSNRNEEAVIFSAYLVGAEVLFRMSGGMLLYELIKYAVIIFLMTGLLVERRKHSMSLTYIFYILLLFIGIVFVEVPDGASLRKAITFNLSGPVALGIGAIYFFKRKISINKLLQVLYFMILPVFSMLTFLLFNTRDISQINFASAANFQATAGYGPNQVSSIMGVGLLIFVIFFLLKRKITGYIIFDFLLISYLFYRELLTFSRGGLLTAIIAGVFFFVLINLSQKKVIINIFKYTFIFASAGIAIFMFTSVLTGGMLQNRYENKNAKGEEKADITTGRADLFIDEFDNFLEHPLFGVGVGSSKYIRLDETGIAAASHNEVSRLLSEHGSIGLLILILLFFTPIVLALDQPIYSKAFLGAFFILWFTTINHSAMRIALPGFMYGLSLIRVTLRDENTIPGE